MVIPQSRTGPVATLLGVLFIIMVTPPVVLLVNTPTLVLGFPVYYLWMVVWGLFVIAVLIWAGWRDAYALTNDQVPPELRAREDIVPEHTESGAAEDTARGGD